MIVSSKVCLCFQGLMKASGVEPEAEIIGGELAGISSDPTQKLIGRKNDFQTTPRRWLVLLTFCGLGLGQAFTWNIFSPIEKQLKTTFDWTEEYCFSFALQP